MRDGHGIKRYLNGSERNSDLKNFMWVEMFTKNLQIYGKMACNRQIAML